MTFQSKIQKIQRALTGVTENCFHYWRAKADSPYLIWAEDGEADSFEGDNHKQEQQIHGTADYFTRTEFDGAVDDIQDALNGIMAGWRLNSVQYEEDTGLIHYEWEWWVV